MSGDSCKTPRKSEPLASAAYGSQTVLQGGEFNVDGMANRSIDNLDAAGNMTLWRAGSAQAGPEGGFCL